MGSEDSLLNKYNSNFNDLLKQMNNKPDTMTDIFITNDDRIKHNLRPIGTLFYTLLPDTISGNTVKCIVNEVIDYIVMTIHQEKIYQEVIKPVGIVERVIIAHKMRLLHQLAPVFLDEGDVEPCPYCNGVGEVSPETTKKPDVTISREQFKILANLVLDKFNDGSVVISANQLQLLRAMFNHDEDTFNELMLTMTDDEKSYIVNLMK